MGVVERLLTLLSCCLLFCFWPFLDVHSGVIPDAGRSEKGMIISKPRSMAGNPHIKLITYRPNGMHYYKGFFGYESSILFNPDEDFEIIAMGDPKGWQINTMSNRMFIKPLDDGAETNATIITRVRSTDEQRVYLFQFHAGEASGVHDEELAYEVRFVYSDGSTYTSDPSLEVSDTVPTEFSDSYNPGGIPDASNPLLNYGYSIAGSREIRPIRVFDDGRFTYIQFAKNTDLPAVLLVDSDGYEGIVNFRSFGDYMVVETIGSLFALHRGPLTACLFNDSKPYTLNKGIKKRSRGVFENQ